MNIGLLPSALSALLIAIILHEMMHALVGYWLGDDTAHAHGRISFNPLNHIDPLTTIGLPILLIILGIPPFAAAKPVPINMHRLRFQEFGMALVGIAGPLTNLLLAVLFALILRAYNPTSFQLLSEGQLMRGESFLAGFLSYSVVLNVGLFVFNMIPFPPLDGSRVLYALAPESLQKLMMQIEQMGFTAILLFMFIGFPFIAPVISRIQQLILGLLL